MELTVVSRVNALPFVNFSGLQALTKRLLKELQFVAILYVSNVPHGIMIEAFLVKLSRNTLDPKVVGTSDRN